MSETPPPPNRADPDADARATKSKLSYPEPASLRRKTTEEY